MPRYPTQPRLFAPVTTGQGTVTAQALARRPPMWLVAVGSGLAALFVAGIVFVILTQLVFSTPPKRAGKPASSSAAPLVTTPVPTLPPGPFQAARSGFLLALASQGPTSMSAPVPSGEPAPLASAASTTPSPTPAANPQPAPVAVVDTRPAPVAPPAQPAPQPAPLAPPTYAQPQAPTRRPAPVSSDSQAQGQLSVICIPACDQVTDNGHAMGASPFFKRPVSVGSHRLRLSAAGFNKTVSVSVIGDQLTTVRESMTP
jgi:hypothetical protein